MLHLFLSTLAMMGLTFLIGFFVAAIIKGIALAADSMDFYSSHLLELQRLRKIKKARARFIQLVWNNSPEEMEALGDSRENWNRGMNSDLRGNQEGGYYHGVSHGASQLNLIDYYYPDTKMIYLKKREEMHNQQQKSTHVKKNLSMNK